MILYVLEGLTRLIAEERLSDPSAVLLFTSYHVIAIQDLPHYANRAGEIEDETRDHARDFDAVALWRACTSG